MVEIELGGEKTHKVVTQDYIILGKRTSDVEVRINLDGSNMGESWQKVENMIILSAYANHRYNGGERGVNPVDRKEGENDP